MEDDHYYVAVEEDLSPFHFSQRLWEYVKAHLTKYRGPYGFIFLLWAFLLWYSSNLCSGPAICMNKAFFDSLHREYLSNVTLYPQRTSTSAPEDSSISVYADVSGNTLHITSGDHGTRLELQKWDGKGTTGGLYAEIPDEKLCRLAGCPPLMFSGDFIGIPTLSLSLLPSQLVVMYTIFLVPTLEERARERIYYNGLHLMEPETVWEAVVQHCCNSFFAVLGAALIGIFVFARRVKVTFLRIRAPSRSTTVHQHPKRGQKPGSVNGQDYQGVGRAASTCKGPDVAGDPSSPAQHSSDVDTSRLRSVPDDLRGSTDSLVSTVSERRMRGTTHTTLVSTTASRGTSSDKHITNDSSSEDDSNPPCNIQEECTTDVPPPHYTRHRPHAVYETPAIGTGVPRPTPQGSGCCL